MIFPFQLFISKLLKVFEIDDMKAWRSVLISVTSYALGLLMISKVPWYLLPLAWAWTGTAVTGVSSAYIFTMWYISCEFYNVSFPPLQQLLPPPSLFPSSSNTIRFLSEVTHFFFLVSVKFFVIGHDCAHKSFSRNKLVEDIVGTLAFLPLIYPYEPWRFKHDQHHAKTNMYVTFPIELSQAIRKKKYGLLSIK